MSHRFRAATTAGRPGSLFLLRLLLVVPVGASTEWVPDAATERVVIDVPDDWVLVTRDERCKEWVPMGESKSAYTRLLRVTVFHGKVGTIEDLEEDSRTWPHCQDEVWAPSEWRTVTGRRAVLLRAACPGASYLHGKPILLPGEKPEDVTFAVTDVLVDGKETFHSVRIETRRPMEPEEARRHLHVLGTVRLTWEPLPEVRTILAPAGTSPQMSIELPRGWATVRDEANDGEHIIECVHPRKSPRDWRDRLIVSVEHASGADDLAPEEAVGELAALLRQRCDGAAKAVDPPDLGPAEARMASIECDDGDSRFGIVALVVRDGERIFTVLRIGKGSWRTRELADELRRR